MKCSFCGDKDATVFTTESDYVCRDCGIQFEISMGLSDDAEYAEYDAYLDGKFTPEFAAKIESETAFWEAHFDDPKKRAEDELDGRLFEAYMAYRNKYAPRKKLPLLPSGNDDSIA